MNINDNNNYDQTTLDHILVGPWYPASTDNILSHHSIQDINFKQVLFSSKVVRILDLWMFLSVNKLLTTQAEVKDELLVL